MPNSRFLDAVKSHFDTGSITLLAVMVLAGYLATMSPDIQWLDSSELQAAAVLLDIAHPPGEPLYAIVTHAMRFVPIGSLAFRVTVVTALCGLLAVLTVYRILTRITVLVIKKTDWRAQLLALGLTVFMAFSHGTWIQNTRSEVYSLNFLLLAIILNLCLCAMIKVGDSTRQSQNDSGQYDGFFKYICLVSFLLGLASGNHSLLISLMAPAILIFLILPNLSRLRFSGLLLCCLFFFIGLSVYLYLILRASASPPINWGNPDSFERLVWMISGKMFQKSFHITMGQLTINFRETMFILMAQVTPVLFFIGILGLWMIVRRHLILGGFLICLLVFNLISVVTQEVFIGANPDLLGYLLLSNLIIVVGVYWFCTEVLRIFGTTKKTATKSIAAIIIWVLLIVLTFSGLPEKLTKVDKHDSYSANLFGKAILNSAGLNGVIITSNIATYFTTGYLQNVERYREDIMIIHHPFLVFDWYVENLRKNYPRLQSISPQLFKSVDDLLPYLKDGSIYFELGLGISDHLIPHLLPHGLVFEYYHQNQPLHKEAIVRQRSRKQKIDDILTAEKNDVQALKTIFWHHYCNGIFYAKREFYDQARWEFERSLALSPKDKDIALLIRQLENEIRTGQKGDWNFINKRKNR
jgi:hypothetical protein